MFTYYSQNYAGMIGTGLVVRHLPFNTAPTVLHFLNRSVNKGTEEVTGKQINSGAGYRLKILFKYLTVLFKEKC